MMLGWLSDAAVRASRLNRSAIPSPVSRAGDITLMATLRSSAISCARKTAAMPPRPSSPCTSYSPMVAWRSSSISAAAGAVARSRSVGATKAVATFPWGPETSAPQRAQNRAPGGIASPQRAGRKGLGPLQYLGDGYVQLARGRLLGNEPVCAGPEREIRDLPIQMHRDHQYAQAREPLPHRRQHLEPVAVRHRQVEQQEIGLVFGDGGFDA